MSAMAFCKAVGITYNRYKAKMRAVHYVMNRRGPKFKKWSK